MQMASRSNGVVADDCLRVVGRIFENLHHFFSVSWVLFDCSSSIVFSVTSIVGLNERA